MDQEYLSEAGPGNVVLWLCLSLSCQSALGTQGCSAGARTEAFSHSWLALNHSKGDLVNHMPSLNYSQLAM